MKQKVVKVRLRGKVISVGEKFSYYIVLGEDESKKFASGGVYDTEDEAHQEMETVVDEFIKTMHKKLGKI